MKNLLAYIPVPNKQYLEWIGNHVGEDLYLIPQAVAESLVPRLVRNMGAVPADHVSNMVRAVFSRKHVQPLPVQEDLIQVLVIGQQWVMPEEDVCHAFAEKYLIPAGCQVEFESIWARWDMSAVKRQEPVIPDLEVSSEEVDLVRMKSAAMLAKKSPDWWRQIGAVAYRDNTPLACAFNTHMPNEYVSVILGDPALNRDAGTGEFDITSALHAEEGIICQCAMRGISLKGASLYSTTLPCPRCTRLVAAAGFSDLFYYEGYSMLGAFETLRAYGVRIIKVKNPETA